MAPHDIYALLEDIPSGGESDVDSINTDEEEQCLTEENIFDIDQMPMVFEDDMNQDAIDEDSDWDIEDNIPLSTIKAQELAKVTVWTTAIENCVQNKKNFTEATGPNIPNNLESPVDVFLHIFPSTLIEKIAFQTNLYALQKNGGNTRYYTPTSKKEIQIFLGINILMGLKKLPSYCDYWSSKPELRDSFISGAMTRDRFAWLLGHIHLADNSVMPSRESPSYDKLYKVRLLLDTLTETFSQSYKPSKNQSIDESMIRFKGRSCLKQFMPLKPVKRGYKVWIRADESGYACQFQVYTGKVNDTAEKELGSRVVKDLTRDLVGKGHHIYFDNFFNSIALQKQLQAELIYACGTVRSNRKGLPDDIKADKELTRGESDWRISKDGLAFIKWRDRKCVLFLGNHHNPSIESTVSRKQKDGTSQSVVCPAMGKDYNKHMGYVDKLDMLKSVYEIDRKSRKWYHRILWYFVDLSIINSFIIFKQRAQSTAPTLKNFRLSVAAGLIGAQQPVGSKKPAPINHFKRNVPYEIRYDQCLHMPIHSNSRRCAFCSTTQEPHRSRWSCSTCDVALCLSDRNNCFLLYHKK